MSENKNDISYTGSYGVKLVTTVLPQINTVKNLPVALEFKLDTGTK